MAKYGVECPECGTTYRVDLIGPHKDRDWKLNNWDWTCDDCKEKARQAENAKAAAANAEAGLPSLAGSEKMIAWAETIRKQKLSTIDEEIQKRDIETAPDKDRLEVAISQLKNRASAEWWIDNRDMNVLSLLKAEYQNTEKPLPAAEQKISEEAKLQALAEATVRPEKVKTETVAEIRVSTNSIEVHFPEKREDFWQLIKKQLHLSWTGSCWRRDIIASNGPVEDRAAEVGNKLLAAGFPVRIFNTEIRARAIAGQFSQEYTRWIKGRMSGQYCGWFSLSWPYGEDFYNAARKLKGSKYDKPNVVVPPEQFESVLDFAEMYGFQLSVGAQGIAGNARKIKDAAMTAHVETVERTAPPEPGVRPQRLDVPENVEVADEFKEVTT